MPCPYRIRDVLSYVAFLVHAPRIAPIRQRPDKRIKLINRKQLHRAHLIHVSGRKQSALRIRSTESMPRAAAPRAAVFALRQIQICASTNAIKIFSTKSENERPGSTRDSPNWLAPATFFRAPSIACRTISPNQSPPRIQYAKAETRTAAIICLHHSLLMYLSLLSPSPFNDIRAQKNKPSSPPQPKSQRPESMTAAASAHNAPRSTRPESLQRSSLWLAATRSRQ